MSSVRRVVRAGGWVLASSSPRRQLLIKDVLEADFEVLSPCVDELHVADMSPQDLTLENARRKAVAASTLRPGAWCLGADTLVFRGGEPLGKPVDLAEARAMLLALSGGGHEVCTSVWICSADGRQLGFSQISRVWMRVLSESLISQYHSLVNPLDKAGGYGIQEHGELIIERLEGSFSNVMGLPTEALHDFLVARFPEAPGLRRMPGVERS